MLLPQLLVALGLLLLLSPALANLEMQLPVLPPLLQLLLVVVLSEHARSHQTRLSRHCSLFGRVL